MVADMSKLVKSPVFWLKMFELLLIFVMVGLMSNTYFIGNPEKTFVVWGTVYAYFIINTSMIGAFMLDEPMSKHVTMALTIVAGVLFVTAGALMIECWDLFVGVNDLLLGAGILGVILGVIYLADTAYTFKFD